MNAKAALKPLTDEERLDWLQLYRSENVGPITFNQLLDRFGSARAALRSLPDLGKKGGRVLKIASRDDVTRELERSYKFGAKIIASCEPNYPQLLAELEDAPPIIIVKGFEHLLTRPELNRAIGVVGARNASINGLNMAEAIAFDLASAGWIIASGLARGIDAAAHRGALRAGSGGTIAFIAGGIDTIYPPENESLYEEISDRGLLVTEVPFGVQPIARHFPRRNRLISGLSLGLLVVEATVNSGSLITARLAAEQGREVFAIPGSPLDPRCRGSNSLLRDGAILTESAGDILEAFEQRELPYRNSKTGLSDVRLTRAPNRSVKSSAQVTTEAEIELARSRIPELLSATPTEIDRLIEVANIGRGAVQMVLLELELAGKVQRQIGNSVSLTF
ncbi:MAG: DNA-processing protein DprA [Candidatus Pacebacteria bacterium]|nr:DNA-processing protein DprA [Candidatus Paceibacterota bacterium]